MDAMPLTMAQELSGWSAQIAANIERLQEDHDNAKWLADQLRLVPALNTGEVSVRQETNMVFVRLPGAIAKVLPDYLTRHSRNQNSLYHLSLFSVARIMDSYYESLRQTPPG
jgi:threonine aldolase